MLKTNKSIVYVNYCPYENSGHILHYLLENFSDVYLFAIAFHSLGSSKQLNKFTHYKDGKMLKDEHLFYMKVPQSLVFILIPIRSLMNAYQIVTKVLSIKKNNGPIDIYFTVNAYTATIGRLLKNAGVVKKSIFWVWDYYPLTFPSLIGKIMRLMYWQLDKYATFSDTVCYLHPRLAEIRKEKNVIPKNKKVTVVPIGTGEMLPIKKKSFGNIKIGFIGVLKKSQGLGMIVDSAYTLSKHFKKITFEIIGSGPDGDYFKSRVKKNPHVTYNFYGLVDEKKFEQILYNATIGVSPYMQGEGTVSKYTDPGKPKRYIEFNLPVITTDVIEISSEIKKEHAGEIVTYEDYEGFAKAIEKVVKKYDTYIKGTRKIHKKYYYKNLYPRMFK